MWWIPQGPTYRRDDPPVSKGWAFEVGDIPGFEPLVRRTDASGTRWVALHAYDDWNEEVPEDEEPWFRRRREIWSHVCGWLVRPTDLGALVPHLEGGARIDHWMREGRDHTDAAYLGELPWAAAAENTSDTWSELDLGGDGPTTQIGIRPAWERYYWEGNVLDCSIDDGVAAEIPDRILFGASELTWMPGSREWRAPDGTTVAQYRDRKGHHVLLVRENWLNRTLQRCGYSMVFGWFGEKRLLPEGFGVGLVGGWTQIGGVASLSGGQWAFGQRRLTRHAVRR